MNRNVIAEGIFGNTAQGFKAMAMSFSLGTVAGAKFARPTDTVTREGFHLSSRAPCNSPLSALRAQDLQSAAG